MASSASGFAALATASCDALGLQLSPKELSRLARRGSGSASRSLFGGFVQWESEYAFELRDKNFWPELRDIVVILDDKQKVIGSSFAMNLTATQSEKYKLRLQNIFKILDKTKDAICSKNFDNLALAIMQDSDNLHECIEEAGIKYLDDESEKIKKMILELNKEKAIAAYTFDAGPNAHIITTKEHVGKIESLLRENIKFMNIVVSKPGFGARLSEKHLF